MAIKNVALIVFLFLVLTSFVSAEEQINLGVFSQFDDVELFLDCSYVNGSLCSSGASCNITRLQYPNGSLMVVNGIMGNDNYPTFNFSVPDSSIIGEYQGNQFCADGSESGTQAFFYEVNPLGRLQTTAQGINSSIFFFIIVSFLVLFIVLTFVFGKNENLWMLSIMTGGLSIIFLIYSLHLGYLYMLNLAVFESGAIRLIYFVISIFTVMSVFLGLVFYFMKIILMLNEEKRNRRNSDGWDGILHE